ncbi:MAG: 50S ribosomal protein L32 [Candidatus Dependentiae bacterium]|nr:50S ribosomal protein L32 [Candidatus Dependentiae bacterium]
MAVPKRKHSKARSRSRRTHQVEHVTSITNCLNCNTPINTHQVCASCGFYKGVKVLATKADRAVKRGQVRQAKEARTTQQEQPVQAEAMNS